MSDETQPLLRPRASAEQRNSLSASLPSTPPYLLNNPYTYQTSNSTNASTPGSTLTPMSPPIPRKPLERIHHLPPPHLHQQALPTLPPSGNATPLIQQQSPAPTRRHSILSLASSAAPAAAANASTSPATKRVEVVNDLTGKPQVREEREWPNPKKNAQYDEDTLFDYHSLLVVSILFFVSLIFYELLPDTELLGNPVYVWTVFLLSLFAVYHLAQLAEVTLLKLLSLASGSRVWKIYFYSQALHETLGNVLTILYVMGIRYYCPYIEFPVYVEQYLDPILRFSLLMFIAVLLRQIITKHLTYVVNQERYAKAVQDLLFKGQVLARLRDPFAYQPLYERPKPTPSTATSTSNSNTSSNPSAEVPFPYTPIIDAKRKAPLVLAAASSHSPHPLYDIFHRLRDFNDTLDDNYLPGGRGVQFFSSEKTAKAKAKELFRNVDRDRKGYLDIHDFRAFFPRETALRAFKLFFPPKTFKVKQTRAKVEKEKASAASTAPPMPFALIKDVEEREGAAAEKKGSKKKGKKGTKVADKAKDKSTAGSEQTSDKVNDGALVPATATVGKPESGKKAKSAKSAPSTPAPPRKSSSATILATLEAEHKEAALGPLPSAATAAQRASSSSAATIIVPAPVRRPSLQLYPPAVVDNGEVAVPILADNLDSDLSAGDMVLDAQSDLETHLRSIQLTYPALESRILGFAEARQTLSRQLRDLDGLADVMQSLSQILFWVVVLFILIIVFDEHIQTVMFSLSTILLSFTFVFATTIKDIFQAIILIFATKPYSVGDRVNIGKDKYRVHSIQLLTTTFRDLQNKISIVPNNKLAAASIQNLTRSANVVVKMKISVAFDTPSAKLASLRQTIVDHVHSLPEQWKPTVSMHLVDLQPHTNTVNVSLLLSHLASYTQVKEWKRSKTELLHVIREAMIHLGIAWKNPESSVSIVNSDSIHTLIEGVGQFMDGYGSRKKQEVKLIEEVGSDGKSIGKKGLEGGANVEQLEKDTDTENGSAAVLANAVINNIAGHKST